MTDDRETGVPPKEWYTKQGVPVGFGQASPEDPDLAQAVQEAYSSLAPDEIEQLQAAEAEQPYVNSIPSSDKAKIIQFVNEIKPFRKDREGNIVSGHADPKNFFDYHGWLATLGGMTNLSEKDIAVMEIDLELQTLEVLMSTERNKYDAMSLVNTRNAEHLAKIRLHQNKDGFERVLAGMEFTDARTTHALEKSGGSGGPVKRAISMIKGGQK